ncbi:TetR/AcrR family transcriptional regulator [Carnobacterium pleistocenium]|uniref:TetR/AcrR family transcriptional regulator n=1 Tax=Carnobacterium pleistocenium TaxID=181073 RepID=UPI00054E8D53|nr:TetR/AcrR family transcriptional regulator [Carnobacterium pleistocenium]
MARKKTILKSQILETAYQVVKKEGFEGFTARNIAKTMDCSTQPIYLEFKSMDDLKHELMVKIRAYIDETIYKKERTEEPMLNMCLNYVYFAKEEPVFFKALFFESQLDTEQMHIISYDQMMKLFEQYDGTKELTKAGKIKIFKNIWITVHGTAVLVAQGFLKFHEKDVTDYIKQALEQSVPEYKN